MYKGINSNLFDLFDYSLGFLIGSLLVAFLNRSFNPLFFCFFSGCGDFEPFVTNGFAMIGRLDFGSFPVFPPANFLLSNLLIYPAAGAVTFLAWMTLFDEDCGLLIQ